MKGNLSERQVEKLINAVVIVSLIFIAVIMFIFVGTTEMNITLNTMSMIFRNMLSLLIVAEFIIIVMLLYRLFRK